MPEHGEDNGVWPDPDAADIMAGGRRISRPDSALPDWHIPDAVYRPVPIAWFAAAFLLQMILLTALFLMLLQRSPWATIGLSVLATLGLAAWTWERGMRDAGAGWQVATALVMGAQLALVCIGAAARF